MDDKMKIAGLIFAGHFTLLPANALAWTYIPPASGNSLPSIAHDVAAHPKTTLLTIITASDPQTQLMALALTRAAMAQGEIPRILLCSSAGDLALRNAPAESFQPQRPSGASPASMIRSLISDKVDIQVCATYLPNRNMDKGALLEGVGVAAPTEIAKIFIDRTVRVLTY